MVPVEGTSVNIEVNQTHSTAFNYNGTLVAPIHFDTFKLTHSEKRAVEVIISYVENKSS